MHAVCATYSPLIPYAVFPVKRRNRLEIVIHPILGIRAEGLTRLELLALVRRVMRAGIAAVEAAERTVTFEVAAWGSVQARAGRRTTTKRDLRHYVRRILRIEGVSRMPLRLIHGVRQQDCFIPRNWSHRWRALRRAAGFRSWVSDVCRHTFATYHAAYFRNLSELQLEMGHRDVSLLRCRYMVPTLRKIAKEFWCKVQEQ